MFFISVVASVDTVGRFALRKLAYREAAGHTLLSLNH